MLKHAIAAAALAAGLTGVAGTASAQYYTAPAPGYYYHPRSPVDQMNREFQQWWNRHFTIFRGGPDYDRRRSEEYRHWRWCRDHRGARGCNYYYR